MPLPSAREPKDNWSTNSLPATVAFAQQHKFAEAKKERDALAAHIATLKPDAIPDRVTVSAQCYLSPTT